MIFLDTFSRLILDVLCVFARESSPIIDLAKAPG